MSSARSARSGRRAAMWFIAAVLASGTLGAAGARPVRAAAPTTNPRCQLTPGMGADGAYKANAPVRSHVGTGFVLTGTVRSGIDCATMRGVRVELWVRGPDGQYDDLHRGTVITDGSGRFRFESNFPGGSFPHIHVRVAAPGYRPLVTTYVPRSNSATGVLDLVLEPEV